MSNAVGDEDAHLDGDQDRKQDCWSCHVIFPNSRILKEHLVANNSRILCPHKDCVYVTADSHEYYVHWNKKHESQAPPSKRIKLDQLCCHKRYKHPMYRHKNTWKFLQKKSEFLEEISGTSSGKLHTCLSSVTTFPSRRTLLEHVKANATLIVCPEQDCAEIFTNEHLYYCHWGAEHKTKAPKTIRVQLGRLFCHRNYQAQDIH